jgi:protein-S-isoprenylcysteine O-methyltransferase Ste14
MSAQSSKHAKRSKPSKAKSEPASRASDPPPNEPAIREVGRDEEEAAAGGEERRESPPPKGQSAYRGPQPGGKRGGTTVSIWHRATYRWVAITVVMAALLVLYTQHPYYRNNQNFQPFRTIFPTAFFLWLALGLFYVKATIERFSERRYVFRDSGLHLLLLAKVGFVNSLSRAQWYAVGLFVMMAAALGALRGSATPSNRLLEIVHGEHGAVALYLSASLAVVLFVQNLQPKRILRVARNPRVRTTLLGIIVKGFFTPLMLGFFVGHLNSISRQWLSHKQLPPIDFKAQSGLNIIQNASLWWKNVGVRLPDFIPSLHDLSVLVQPWTWTRADLSWGLGLAYDIIFAVDCGWALFGYSTESRWLGNKTRSVEPTAFGWAVCLACYPPFNNILGTYLPLQNGPSVVTSQNWLLVLRAGTVFLFAIYASATVAFGFRFSNLTNRGIVSRGPYRFVRHPAYLCKCTAWWLEHIPTMTLAKAFFLSCLCGVYALRAWTEERHLSKDPDYLAYKKKVPWVIFPGVY